MMIKTVKVSDKGQISIPTDFRALAGINKGDTLIMLQDKGKILIEKTSKRILEDFSDLLKHSEKPAKDLWSNKKDEIWDTM